MAGTIRSDMGSSRTNISSKGRRPERRPAKRQPAGFALPTYNLSHASGPNQTGLWNSGGALVAPVERLRFQPQQLRRIGLGHLHNVRLGDALRDQSFVERQQSVRMERIVGLTQVG